VANAYFDGKRCGIWWFAILSAARRAGVSFHMNQGRRTLAEQRHFWNIYQRNGWPVAAYPNPNAPHIKNGAENHALDVNTPGVYSLGAWLRRQGASVAWTVRGEPWHIEVPYADLARLYRKFKGAAGPSTKEIQRRLVIWMPGYGVKPDGNKGPITRTAIKDFQRIHGLTVDGKVGSKTWAVLKRKRVLAEREQRALNTFRLRRRQGRKKGDKLLDQARAQLVNQKATIKASAEGKRRGVKPGWKLYNRRERYRKLAQYV
jgi:hypothetical protein